MENENRIPDAAKDLEQELDSVRHYQQNIWLGEGLGLFLVVVIPALGLAMLMDNLVHLNFLMRLGLLLALFTASFWLIRRALRPLFRPLTLEQVALKVERCYPELENRLINSLLLSRDGNEASKELIQSVVEEGKSEAEKLDLRSSIPKRRMKVSLTTGVLALAMMIVYFFVAPEYFQNALARVILPFAAPEPITRTRIIKVTPEDQNVLSGDDLQIEVELGGWLPESTQIVYEPEEDEIQVQMMDKGSDATHFSYQLKELSRSFAYRILAGDARSEKFKVTVNARPVISEMNVNIDPPKYAGLETRFQKSSTIKALPGSLVSIRGVCSKPIARATLTLLDAEPQEMTIVGEERTVVTGSFEVKKNGTYRISLVDASRFESRQVDHEIEAIVDDPPEIRISNPPANITVKPDESLPFQCLVTDYYGVREVEILRVIKDLNGNTTEESLRKWATEERTVKSFPLNYRLPVADLKIRCGESGILQVVARDWNDVTGPGVAKSAPITVRVMLPETAREEREKGMKEASAELSEIIRKQRENLAMGRELRSDAVQSPDNFRAANPALNASIQLQEDVRALSGKLLEKADEKLPIRPVIQLLFENEMIQAVRQLQGVPNSENPSAALKTAVETERVILSKLTGRKDQLEQALDVTALRDIFASLDALIRDQKKLRDDTNGAVAGGATGPNEPLADRQDQLAERLTFFKEELTGHAGAVGQTDADTGERFRKAVAMLDERSVRPNMLRVASKLAQGELEPSLPVQDQIITDLKAVSAFLREPLVAAAAKKLEELKDLAKKGKEKAEKLAELQGAVKEISEELERSKDLTEGKTEKLNMTAEELKEIRQNMQDVVEQMAKDLHMFPEIPACNEIMEKNREVFEDIEQAKGSENAPVEEIAVDRDEGLLEALKKVKERFADMEMWLMDKPDNIKWKQEGWDTEEITKIPLVDLPEELEDLVGDLVDQAEEQNEESNDSASNAMVADAPMGWDVADGPISSFGAKGKSGNERPNTNEMTGRSGAGREGASNGEIVGKVAKDLEGTPTKARRTRDPFAKGNIEEENPNSAAKATGGGKQSGIGGEGGLTGAAPPRDQLHMRDLARRQQDMKRNAESLYTKASLLYLPTGEMDEALLLMQKAEEQAKLGDMQGFSETQRRIVHALRNTQKGLDGEETVALDPRLKLPKHIKEEMVDTGDEPIPPEFEKLVSDYYKAIATGAVK
jgi:hypothetical protein